MREIGRITTELIFLHRPGNRSAAAIVPSAMLPALEADRDRLGHTATWWYEADPDTGEDREAFKPIQGGPLTIIQNAGIRHGDRFEATFLVRERNYRGVPRREMWLIEARRIDLSTTAERLD